MTTSPPPLTGLKVLEFAGLAPGPYAGLILADAGASVLRIDRADSTSGAAGAAVPTPDLLTRHKASIAVDLKSPGGVALVRALAGRADVLLDPFRPGVLEKLGLGPDALLHGTGPAATADGGNPRLVYARLTGFRRDGRYRAMAGHDINYLAVSGVLAQLGRRGGRPLAPLNLLADFAGGGATLVQGVLMALVARARSGRGQVVEANMVDGSAYVGTFARLARGTAAGDRPRGENLLDSGCPYYDTYETADGGHVAVGALEPRFFEALVRGLGLEGRGWEERRLDRGQWPALRAALEEVFRSRPRAHWERVFDGTDACCTPVLDYAELEMDGGGREGDQRPAVTLRDTPWLAIKRGARDPSEGQGPGVAGEGYRGQPLAPGENGAAVLQQWMGWTEGQHFEVQDGGLVLKEKPKL